LKIINHLVTTLNGGSVRAVEIERGLHRVSTSGHRPRSLPI
jgi:hypothetical protein